MSGVYSLTVQLAGCSATASLTVTVNAAPTTPTVGATPNPVCIGGTLNLTTNATGVSYAWSGPGAFSTSTQNPTRAVVATTPSGAYSLTITNGAGCTASATTSYVTVSAGVSAPVSVSAGSATQTSLNVIFNGVVGVTTFRIGYRIKGATNWVYTTNFIPSSIGGGQYVRSVTGLQAGSTYEFVVQAVSPCGGYTESSNIVESATANGAAQTCRTPNDIFADVTGPSTAVLGFQVDAGAYSCVIISYGLQTQSPSLWTNVTVAAGTTPNVLKTRLISGLLPNTTYSYRMRTNCAPNCSVTSGSFSAWSPIMSFRTTSAREAENIVAQTNAPKFSLYPNPNRGNFTLSFYAETTTNRIVEIFDMTGRLIHKQSFEIIPGKNEISFDLTAQPRGVYLLKTESYSAKVMVE